MKYRFEIHYMDKFFKKFNEILSNIDLGVNCYAMKDVRTFSIVHGLSINDIKEKLVETYNACDCDVVFIEGGLVE